MKKKSDSISVYPTDTLYGICASAFSKKAVGRIYELKGRDELKPFIVLISDISELKQFGVKLTSDQKKLLKALWPNPVSVILPCTLKKFEYLHRGGETLAFRMPKKKVIRDILKKTGPLVAPSANPQGLTPAHTIREAKQYFGHSVDEYVSGGRLEGKPSTVISLVHTEPILIREGIFNVKKYL